MSRTRSVIVQNCLILVTGASGFIGTHVVKLLQEEGYQVRGTVRSLKDEKKVKHLYNLCPNAQHKLELVEADLLKSDTWAEAVKDCEYIHHVASPFPAANPRHEDEVVKPAVEGTLNVLKAAAGAKTVKRVVLTSSIVSVALKGGNINPLTEDDWADPNHPLAAAAYNKSKILAERAAWDFVKDLPQEEKFELTVVNPCLVVGPTLHGDDGTSIQIIKRLMERQIPACPRFNFGVIDVRDVALAHLKCMTVPEAAGHRHILVNCHLWYKEIAEILDKEFREQGYNVPTGELPGFLVTLFSWFDSGVKIAKNFASEPLFLDNSRMRNVLGIDPTDKSKSIIDMAYSLIESGFVRKTAKYKQRPSTDGNGEPSKES